SQRLLLGSGFVLMALVGGAVASARWLFAEPSATNESPTVKIGTSRLLAVLPHPDDENWVAGLLADATRRGVEVRLITAARGDGGGADGSTTREELARIREVEVRRHGAALGLRGQEVWS